MTDEVNIYLRIPLDRVRADALHGVRLAVEAWRARDTEGAARELGRIIEPGHEHELFRLPRPAPSETEKPVRRKVRKKATARARKMSRDNHATVTVLSHPKRLRRERKRRRQPMSDDQEEQENIQATAAQGIKAVELLHRFSHWSLTCTPREKNTAADKLAHTAAMSRHNVDATDIQGLDAAPDARTERTLGAIGDFLRTKGQQNREKATVGK